MRTQTNPLRTESEPAKARLIALVITLVITMGVCWGVIFSGNLAGRGASDDLLYHWVAINQFAQEWPTPDLGDYASATTPGYHLVLAPLVRSGLGHMGTQLVASIWTLALFALLSWMISRRWGLASAVLMLPLTASMYFVYPGIWLLPDNAGWLLVLGILLLALQSRSSWGVWALSGVLLVALVWARQVHIWAAGIVWLTAWLGNESETHTDLRSLFRDPVRRIGRTLTAQGLTIPAFVTLVWFLGTWGGLVPPSFQDRHQGPNLATPGFMLTQLAILSVFFAPVLLTQLRSLWAHHWRLVLLAIFVGLVLGVVPHSSYSIEDGRYSGWWNLLGKFPTLADRSPIFMLGSIAGAVSLTLWLSLAPKRDVWIWLGVLVAFTLAQTANHASWQRYHEPMLLMMIVLIFARSVVLDHLRVRVLLGSLVLSMVLGAITISSIMGAKPIQTGTNSAQTGSD
ncbi:MAG: hypothetical protein ACF8MF_12780 [Phycisphaerales bacterium JB052]